MIQVTHFIQKVSHVAFPGLSDYCIFFLNAPFTEHILCARDFTRIA